MRLILASGSQRRRELMSMCGYNYEVIVSDADEHTEETDPEKYVKILAERKALEVFSRLAPEGKDSSDIVVVGSDTVVSFNGRIIGKPTDEEDAARILTLLSGQTHRVYTGVTIVTAKNIQSDCSVTDVTFSNITPEEIQKYVHSGDPMDKAGAYGIQGPFGMFVEKVNGNYFTVIGLPLPMVYHMLSNVGVLPDWM